MSLLGFSINSNGNGNRPALFRALFDLAVSLTADRDLDDTLTMVAERAREILNVDTAYIALRDKATGEVYMHSLAGIRTEAFKKMRVPFGTGLGGVVAQSRKAMIVENYFTDPSISKRVVDGVVTAEGLVSGMAAPILMGEANLGVCYSFNRKPTKFTSYDLEVLSLLANIAAVAISHHEDREKLKLLLVKMEDKVSERTAELTETAARLRMEVSEKNRALEMQRGLEAQLAESQKMEAIGRLAGGIAHDFNNLLTSIIGHAELAQEKIGPDSRAAKDVAQIINSGERAAALTQQLLAYSRRQLLKPSVIDLSEAALDSRGMLGRLLGETIELRIDAPAGLNPIKVDKSQLNQVLLNLSVNARDAMADGGMLTIRVSQTHVSEKAESPSGEFVTLSVSDTGVGMDQDTVSHIFEPFFTTKEVGKGTGLGLATVHGIVAQSGGFIELISSPDKGTEFKVYFPAVSPQTAEEGESAEELCKHSGVETILVVEDDPDVLELVSDTLTRQGYRPLTAASGEEALTYLSDMAHEIDLLVTDVVMRGMNGRTLAGRAEDLRPGIKKLFMSGYTEDAAVLKAIREDRLNFIQKPFLRGALLRTIREILDNRQG